MERKYKEITEIAKQIADVMQSKKKDNEEVLKSWIANNSTTKEVIDMLSSEEKLSKELASFDKNELCNKSVINLKRRIIKSRNKKVLRISSYGIAAAVIAISLLIWNKFDDNKLVTKENIVTHVAQMNVDVPTLILEDGMNVNLDKAEGDVASATIVKNNQPVIKYAKIANNAVACKLNTLIIPSKFVYSVELSDGTKVMLNANSKLIYPVIFGNDKREVTLQGEAYFDVSKSKIPFIVNVKGVSVRVYGTKFNVNSYKENRIETVLLSGSVGVSISDKTDLLEQLLKPNQLSNVNIEKGENKVIDVKAEDYLSWTHGTIKSYDSTLGSLIEKLSYWYGVDFRFIDESKWIIPVTASFNSNQSLEKVISAIEYASNVKIKKEKGGYVID